MRRIHSPGRRLIELELAGDSRFQGSDSFSLLLLSSHCSLPYCARSSLFMAARCQGDSSPIELDWQRVERDANQLGLSSCRRRRERDSGERAQMGRATRATRELALPLAPLFLLACHFRQMLFLAGFSFKSRAPSPYFVRATRLTFGARASWRLSRSELLRGRKPHWYAARARLARVMIFE